MTAKIILAVTFSLLAACAPKPDHQQSYPLQVGDIQFDEKLDDPDFVICDEIRMAQYYHFSPGLQYKGEKIAIDDFIRSRFSNQFADGETGYVTIRFIVNCNGQTGYFRVQQMGMDYNEKQFRSALVKELLELTKQLDGWIPAMYEETAMDFYQYLTFKIEDGQLTEILP